jgi:hypothetical protein
MLANLPCRTASDLACNIARPIRMAIIWGIDSDQHHILNRNSVRPKIIDHRVDPFRGRDGAAIQPTSGAWS